MRHRTNRGNGVPGGPVGRVLPGDKKIVLRKVMLPFPAWGLAPSGVPGTASEWAAAMCTGGEYAGDSDSSDRSRHRHVLIRRPLRPGSHRSHSVRLCATLVACRRQLRTAEDQQGFGSREFCGPGLRYALLSTRTKQPT